MPLLVDVRSLAIAFPESGALRRVVDGVTLSVAEGEFAAMVGESGSGKTLTALALLGLVPEPGAICAGAIEVAGTDLVRAGEDALCALRGGAVGLLFQDPSQALNPVRTIGQQVAEAARLHRGVRGREAARLAIDLLDEVGLEGRAVAGAYPHQLSGGQRQRALLAAALSGSPRLLVADEPTSSLDAGARLAFLALLQELQRRHGLSVLVVSHDLGLVAAVARKVTVVYAGETVEAGEAETIFSAPRHPYTGALVSLLRSEARAGAIPTLAGSVPPPSAWGAGCRFAPRCQFAFERCRKARPALLESAAGAVRCFLHVDLEEGRG